MRSISLFMALFAVSSTAWAHAASSNAFLHVLQHALLYFGVGVLVGTVCLLAVRYAFRQPRAPRRSVNI